MPSLSSCPNAWNFSGWISARGGRGGKMRCGAWLRQGGGQLAETFQGHAQIVVCCLISATPHTCDAGG